VRPEKALTLLAADLNACCAKGGAGMMENNQQVEKELSKTNQNDVSWEDHGLNLIRRKEDKRKKKINK
jgi:hypothetical protein